MMKRPENPGYGVVYRTPNGHLELSRICKGHYVVCKYKNEQKTIIGNFATFIGALNALIAEKYDKKKR